MVLELTPEQAAFQTRIETFARDVVALRAAGIDPGARGETLTVEEFARLAEHRPERGAPAVTKASDAPAPDPGSAGDAGDPTGAESVR